ncbi:hypothetical protein RFI_26867 [Reticulomyxa filosa]|uniref:F-box domain-containing protein n=1 Tax=Reticulomyxa filosa TaxID=46433 RepID=X6MA33_RETFI|nr:hypothetical protein RFI_26867 [Reticulomyxa filosa]|eukprot:ETO10511.1 hypothetical protein RFI_26867 [Reticulomyxa filosa]
MKDVLKLLGELFEPKELQEVLSEKMRKMNEQLEKGRTVENKHEYLLLKEKICNTYLCIASMDEILPANVHLHIFSFLETSSLACLSVFSRSFRQLFISNPFVYKLTKQHHCYLYYYYYYYLFIHLFIFINVIK